MLLPRKISQQWKNNVEVMATPVLIWLAELASMNALNNCLESDKMTLGYAHNISHLAPTPIGFTIKIVSILTEIDRKLLKFSISAHDGVDVVLVGTHTRAVVDQYAFRLRVAEKYLLRLKP